jgi:pimeloyl-ACP methyl ester carboxylesterase
MTEAVRGGRPVPLGARLAAVLAAPLAPLFGLLVAYLIYHPPPPRRRRTPSAFELNPTQLWIAVSRGRTRLHAWYLPGDPQRVVVLGHGLGLDKSRSLAQAQLLRQAGYTVVLFDFRNHGASFRDHALTHFSRRFDDDLVAVVDHVRAMPEHAHARVAVWGFSFSTFPVLDTLAGLDGAVHAVICDMRPPTGRRRPSRVSAQRRCCWWSATATPSPRSTRCAPWRAGTRAPRCWSCQAPGTSRRSRSTARPTPPPCSTSSREPWAGSRPRRRAKGQVDHEQPS